MSSNPEKRLIEHNRGDTKSTKGRRPWAIVYREGYDTRQEARSREVHLKSGIGREERDILLKNVAR